MSGQLPTRQRAPGSGDVVSRRKIFFKAAGAVAAGAVGGAVLAEITASPASAASAGKSRVIKGVTVFGNAAIVAETVAGVTPRTVEDVFNYTGGRWRYSPQAPGIYRHRSVSADIAAAKAAGLCQSSKVF